jgi:hypothetical protein
MTNFAIRMDLVTQDPEVLTRFVDAAIEANADFTGMTDRFGDRPAVYVRDREEAWQVIDDLVRNDDGFELTMPGFHWDDARPKALMAVVKDIGMPFVAQQTDEDGNVVERRWKPGMDRDAEIVVFDGKHNISRADLGRAADEGMEMLARIVDAWKATKDLDPKLVVVPEDVRNVLRESLSPSI